ncbi:MAG: HDOD domain-containing protein, partial [Chitinivibrionales bacterium]|nr:HDOD domain-containing protein [Chitinivibrionales bacterium]MBD3356676.1 HDOD domain-containing protein [Chitinivibrionales bacterium]
MPSSADAVVPGMSVSENTTMTQKSPNPERIRRITESIIGLPTLPTVVSKMIELVDNPKTSAGSLARLISTDQSLTARILKLANSAYYGFSREISTVNMAIVVMGFNAVKDMGLSLSVFDIFKNSTNFRHFDITKFWEHSVGCGVASKMIAHRYHHSIAGEAFVAGLLHDIGKVILNQYAHAEFVEIMNRVTMGEESFDDAELNVTGTHHGEVGGWLADKWRLPSAISESIRRHHNPTEARHEPLLVALVTIGDYLCHINAIGNSGRPVPIPPDAGTWRLLHEYNVPLDEDELENLSAEFLLEL